MKDIRLELDQHTVSDGRRTVRHLIATLKAPARPKDDAVPPPLDLGLVIDVSGSMSGPPLEAAKQAAAGVVERLGPDDRLTLVAFEDNVHILFEALTLDPAGRGQAIERILSLGTGGCTNLAGGWSAAGTLLAAEAALTPGRRRHVIVLSDGMANLGLTDPSMLGKEASALLECGVPTSCVGIGDHYSTDQLDALAEHGGGRLHDAETPQEIVEVLLGELGELAAVTAERVSLSLDLPEGVTAVDLAGGPARQRGRTLVCRLGSLRSGAERQLVLRLELEANATRGEPMEFGWEVSWSTPGGRDSHRERGLVKLVPCAGPHAPVSEIHAAVVVEKWVAGLVRRVTSLNRHEGYQEIQDLQRRELPALEAYAQPHPSLAHAVSRVRHLFTQALRPIAERSRKEMYLLSKKLQLREADHRKVHRGAWFDQMPGTESHT